MHKGAVIKQSDAAGGGAGDAGTSADERVSVLVVDDEPGIQRTQRLLFEMNDFEVRTAGDGREALGELDGWSADVIVSDISMPDFDGIRLLREVRKRDLDLPVVLVTGLPSVETAIRAVDLGAHKYVTKPFDHDEMLDIVRRAANLYRAARFQREALARLGMTARSPGDRAGLEARFQTCLDTLHMHYQPLFGASSGVVMGYEALLRTRSDDFPHPPALLEAAEELGRVHDVGRQVRRLSPVPLEGREELLFINLHPSDLSDRDLFAEGSLLGRMASRVVLEITERDRLEGFAAVTRVAEELRSRGFRIAVDDLGAGYSGLNNLATLRPEFVKLDMTLVRNIDTDPVRRKLVQSLSVVSRDIGSTVVAEGVETEAERDTLLEVGVDLLQGFLLGRPQPWDVYGAATATRES